MFDLTTLAGSVQGITQPQATKTVGAGGISDAAKAGVINNAISTAGSVIQSIFGKNPTTTKTNILGTSVTTGGAGKTTTPTMWEWVQNNLLLVGGIVFVILYLFGKPIMRLLRGRR